MAIGTSSTRRANRAPFAALLAVLALAGCVQTGQPMSSARERTVPLEDAFVQAPVGGPQLIEVVERRYPNATEQRILLANRSGVPGSNFLEVRFFGPVGNTGTGRTPLANTQLSNSELVREARAEIAGVPMGRSPLFVQNRYGPFGYAVGRSGEDVCVYAWQRISGEDTSTLLMRSRGTIQLRLRLCDRASSEERLLYTMYGLTVRSYFSSITWNPYGSPPVADPRLGVLNAPILPAGARGFEAIAEPPPPAPAQAPAAPRPRAVAAAPAPASPAPVQAAPLPAPIGPLVPPPPALAPAGAAPAPASSAPPAASASVPAMVPPPPPAAPNGAAACDAAAREAGRC